MLFQWFIPIELHKSLDSVPNAQDRVVTHILIAKARICVQLQVSHAKNI